MNLEEYSRKQSPLLGLLVSVQRFEPWTSRTWCRRDAHSLRYSAISIHMLQCECGKWAWPVSWYYPRICMVELKSLQWYRSAAEMGLDPPWTQSGDTWNSAGYVTDEASSLRHSLLDNSLFQLFPCNGKAFMPFMLKQGTTLSFHFIINLSQHKRKLSTDLNYLHGSFKPSLAWQCASWDKWLLRHLSRLLLVP